MRKQILTEIEKIITKNEKVVFIGSDLGNGVLANAKNNFPDRVIIEGISEQHIVGMAAGIALNGFKVFVHTISTFLYRRAYEQIYLDVALQNLDVCLIGSGGGMVYAPLGPTHQAIEDISILKAIPNMKIYMPCDPNETIEIVNKFVSHGGPSYVRLGKGGEKNITQNWKSLLNLNSKTNYNGKKILIISSGAISQEVNKSIESNTFFSSSITFLHICEINEIKSETIKSIILNNFDKILIVEEHIPSGGIYSQVLDIIEHTSRKVFVKQLSLKFEFPEKYGTQNEHWRHNRIDSESISKSISKLIGS